MNEPSDKSNQNQHRTSCTQSKRKTCPLSCDDCINEDPETNSLSSHYLSECHQRATVERIQQRMLMTNIESDSSKAVVDESDNDSLAMRNYETVLKTVIDLETNVDKLNQLDQKLFQLKRQMSDLSEKLSDAKRDHTIETEQSNAMSLNQQIILQDLMSFIEQLDNASQVIRQEPDGSMIWRITQVQEKIYDAQSERQTSVYSPAFYTSKSGYRLCIRLYLNGDGTVRGTHVSVFLVILRGKYDKLLGWPFSYRVSFCLYDQRTIMDGNADSKPKHIIGCFRPDTASVSFCRPTSSMNIASGITKFCSIDELDCSNNNRNLYIVNDTMYMKTYIDFVGLPRSILPMVYNLNVGLPEAIQQKLISDELQRQKEQNSN